MAEQGDGTASSKGPKISIPPRTYGFPPEAFDWTRLPDVDTEFLPPEHLEAFIQALSAPDSIPLTPDDVSGPSSTRISSPMLQRTPSTDVDVSKNAVASSLSLHDEHRRARETAAAAAAAADVAAPGPSRPSATRRASAASIGGSGLFITAQNDWAPVHERVLREHPTTTTARDNGGSSSSNNRRKKRKKSKTPRLLAAAAAAGRRSKDETREGYLYTLLKWPFLLIVGAWILGLSVSYLATRMYIYLYEQCIAWRGRREQLRRAMRATSRYADWVAAAQQMDDFFGNRRWKEVNEFAYYDSKTVRRVLDQMKRCRARAEKAELREGKGKEVGREAVEDLKVLVEACVKNNFVGIENPRLYSQTYYGTKNLVQKFIDEGEILAC